MKRLRIRSHQIEIAALDYGNEGAPPLLLVHGMRDLAWSLDSIARAFADRFRVIAIDLRGHGDSDRVGYYALPHFVIDLRQAILQLGLEKPLLVGHSFGGELVVQFAGLFPEVPSACVLVEGLGPPPWEGEGSREAGLFWSRRMIEMLDKLDPNGRPVADLDDAVERILKNHPGLAKDRERARFLAEEGTRDHEAGGLRWKWDPFLMTSWGSFNFQQIEQMWQRITCPVLAINGGSSGEFWRRDTGSARRGGDNDAYLLPDELERRLGFFRDVECVEIPDAGHMIHFDQPEPLNDAIDRFVRARNLDAPPDRD